MYPQLLNDMRAASKSIHLLFYEWAADAFTETVRQVLAERVASGVDVRILYDPVGSLTMLSWGYIRRMRSAGVQMSGTRPSTYSIRSAIAVIEKSPSSMDGLGIPAG